MGLKEKEVHLRVTMEEWQYLGALDNHSLYIRDLIIKDRLDRLDHKIIDIKILEHKQAIKHLEELKKSKVSHEKEIKELLEYHSTNYKQNADVRSEYQRIRFIEKSIMPNLKKLGYKGSPQDIDELLLKWPED